MKIAVLTSPNQWFIPYAEVLAEKLQTSKLFLDHREIDESYDLVFILSYHRIISEKYLSKHKYNIVIHASDLPKGKGWAPLFWQVTEGKNNIVFSMFEASKEMDNGPIYMKKTLKLKGYELNSELRQKQAEFIINMCIDFVKNIENYREPIPQQGTGTIYPKRNAKNSELDINRTIKESFNLLRTVNNESYPAFFYIDKHKYILKIYEVENENQ